MMIERGNLQRIRMSLMRMRIRMSLMRMRIRMSLMRMEWNKFNENEFNENKNG